MSTFTDMLTSFEHAASSIYHKVVKVEKDVTAWTKSNPALHTMVDAGVNYGTSLLTAHGVDVPAAFDSAEVVLTSLKKLASADPSMPSVPPPVTVTMIETASSITPTKE